jgi:hypothetical protein
MGGPEAGVVHGGFHRRREGLGGRVDAVRETGRVAEPRHVHGQDVEAPLEQREHRLPASPGVSDAMNEDERVAAAATMVIEPHDWPL